MFEGSGSAKDAIKDSATNNKVIKTSGTLAYIKGFVSSEDVNRRFEAALQKNPGAFLSSIISLVSSSTNFDNVDPNTIMMGAMQAATLDLPINPNLGFAYIIPYKGKAQFQMGWKGFVQLALRTGEYRTINTTEIYEGQLISRNRLSGEIIVDEDKKTSEKIIGYVAFFSLRNGFEKSLYMSVEELEKHGKKYSKSYTNPLGGWKTNTHSMMLKTVLKLLLSKYGILSVQMQQAIQSDQAVVTGETDAGELTYEYVDANGDKEERPLLDNSGDNKEPPLKEPVENEALKTNDPDYWVKEIQKLKPKDVDAFEKKYKKELGAFSGEDLERVVAAGLAQRGPKK